MLLAYVDERGIDLSSEGIAERGLHLRDAVVLIDLLSQHGVRSLGVDPWRHVSGRYRIESVSVWASGSKDPQECNAEAKRVIERLRLGAHDVVTIQF